ncbi:MAG: hypothetical protein ABFS18_11735 [Thermodesulfobacteriota bacterium]
MQCNSRYFLSLALFSIAVLLVQGCATGHNPRRGRLSKAMAKASDKHQGSRRISKGYKSDNGHNHSILASILIQSAAEEYPPSYETDDFAPRRYGSANPEDSVVGLSGGVGLMKGDNFYEMTNLNFFFGNYLDENTRMEFNVGGAWASVDRTNDLDNSIDDGVFLISLGVDYKHLLFGRRHKNSPYLILGAAYKQMWWEYENEIYTSDGAVIWNDSLEGCELHAGVGVNLFESNGTQMAIEALPSVIYWLSQTTEGFDNDVFGPFYLLNIRAALTF